MGEGDGSTSSADLDLDAVKSFGVNTGKCDCKSSQCLEQAPLELPNPRLVSTEFHKDEDAPDSKVTHMVTQWGQFLDHDITLTPEEEVHDCCLHGEDEPYCMAIQIPDNDYFYHADGVDVSCLEFTRSTGFCDEDSDLDSETHEQLNAITAFVDASNVYGSSVDDSNNLRAFDGLGKLAVEGDNLLPGADALTVSAGDVRAPEMPGLAAMHTLFVREHNRLCDALATHPDVTDDWTDEDYFQNARRILIAEMQKIVYADYLPVVLGVEAVDRWDLEPRRDSDYKPESDPSIANSFATAAYRFGHSMIQGLIEMYLADGSENGNYELGKNYFNVERYVSSMEDILLGLTTQAAQTNDRFVTVEATNKLFANASETPLVGGDLVARNIQRGRDHGLPSYAAFYEKFGPDDRGAMECWDKKPKEITTENWEVLKKIYHHPQHIDLFAGGMAEKPYRGGLTGATFNGIKGRQFKALKDGDRFFFSHRDVMTRDEYDEIMNRELSDIICDNTDIAKVSRNVFLLHDERDNRYKTCGTSSDELNISKFQVFRV